MKLSFLMRDGGGGRDSLSLSLFLSLSLSKHMYVQYTFIPFARKRAEAKAINQDVCVCVGERERERERALQGHISSHSPYELVCRVAFVEFGVVVVFRSLHTRVTFLCTKLVVVVFFLSS